MGLLGPEIDKAKPCRPSPEIWPAGSAAAIRFLLILFCFGTFFLAARAPAFAETRYLKIYHVHTGEKAIIAYKRNGHYIPAGLKKLDYILRDWRKDKEINMDPRLFDLLWEVYQKSGSHDYIHVICGYRTGDTNAMLRGRSRASGVAKKSQHILGKAIDFFIPDVPLEKLREIGMKFQVGGVGYYPNSGSPFVHMDTGYVRAWPRMTRQQLVRLFPNGHTLHLPRDGKPLPGYEEALASYKSRVTSDSIMVAGGGSSGRHSGNLLAALFGGGFGDEDEGTLDAGDTVQNNPSLHRIEKKAMAPVHAVSPREAAPVAPATPGNTALPGVAVAMATPGQAASTPDTAADPAPKFADLASYRIPIPELAPDRGAAAPPAASVAEKATAALIARADDAAVPDSRNLPVPGIRPELTAYAPVDDAAAAALAQAPVPPPVAAPLVTPRPSLTAEAAKKDMSRGKIVMASLAPAPALRPHVGKPLPKPVEQFASVTDVRGGRVGTDAGGAPNRNALTQAMIARWAHANGKTGDIAAAPRMGRLAARLSEAVDHQPVDPQRFAAVSVYFPND